MSAAYSFAATGLVIGSLVAFLAQWLIDEVKARWLGLIAGVLALVPPLAAYSGDIVSSLFVPFAPGVLLLSAVVWALPWLPPMRPAGWCELAACLLVAGVFYATSLGYTKLDLYGMFYDPLAGIIASGAIVAAGWLTGRPLVAVLGPLGLLIWLTGLNSSENMADALLHPLMLTGLLPFVVQRRGQAAALA